MRVVRLASIQLEIRDEQSKRDRLAHVEALIDGLGRLDLVVLPEIWNIGYFSFDRYREESESLDGETVRRMARKAREHSMWIMAGSFVESRGDRLYNTSVLLDRRGEVVASYRKIHLFTYGSKEGEILTPGNEITVVETEFGMVGLSTCYDLRFPELYRKMLDKGAEVFLVTAAWPYPRLEHWKSLNTVRAFENQCFLISSNCCGVNRGVRFAGHSAVVDPWGIPVASAGDYEAIVATEIDLRMVHSVRDEFPVLRHRVLQI